MNNLIIVTKLPIKDVKLLQAMIILVRNQLEFSQLIQRKNQNRENYSKKIKTKTKTKTKKKTRNKMNIKVPNILPLAH